MLLDRAVLSLLEFYLVSFWAGGVIDGAYIIPEDRFYFYKISIGVVKSTQLNSLLFVYRAMNVPAPAPAPAPVMITTHATALQESEI